MVNPTAKARARLAGLFEARRHEPLYPSLRAELDAVAGGAKAIAMEVWPEGELAGDRDHAAFVRLAAARGLEVVHRPDVGRGGIPIVAVYALRPPEAWRIPALHALWHAFRDRAWCDGAEALESELLGYTPAQVRAWLARRAFERLGWRGETIYFVARRGDRGLPPRFEAAWCDGTRVVKRTPPAWVARDGRAVARVAVAAQVATQLFRGSGHVRVCEVVAERLPAGAFESKVELLGRRGWR